jgi:hypothetical protein
VANLPIQIPQLTSDQWRSLEKQLIAIAAKEKAELEPRDRLVNNSLFLAQGYARKSQWGDLFRFLIERNIVKIEGSAIAEPPPRKKRNPKAPNPPKSQFLSIKNRFKNVLPQILYSDRALGIQTIAVKARELGIKFSDRLCQEYLNQLAKEGVIYKTLQLHKYSAYALQQTDAIAPEEWLPASVAYRIAVENGYKNSYHFFKNRPYVRTPSPDKVAEFYAQYGIEYDFEHDHMDNQKWRILQ